MHHLSLSLSHSLSVCLSLPLSLPLCVGRLLGGLCQCISDPQLNASSQEIRPAESLGQLLLFHLNSKSALQRIAVALVLCEWAALHKVKPSPAGSSPFTFVYLFVFSYLAVLW